MDTKDRQVAETLVSLIGKEAERQGMSFEAFGPKHAPAKRATATGTRKGGPTAEQTGHTPGPWFENGVGMICAAGKPWHVATVVNGNKADTALIVEAPELLALCSRYVALSTHPDIASAMDGNRVAQDHICGMLGDLADMSRAAISKATGTN